MMRAVRWMLCSLMVAWSTQVVAQLQFDEGSDEDLPSIAGFLQQAKQARKQMDSESERRILEEALQSVGPNSPDAVAVYRALRQYYADRGQRNQALKVAEQEVVVAPKLGQKVGPLAAVITLQSSLSNRQAAQAGIERMNTLLRQLRNNNRAWQSRGDLWQAFAAWAKGTYDTRLGYPDTAEASWRSCLSSIRQFAPQNPHFLQAECSAELAVNLLGRGKLAEAGALMVAQREWMKKSADSQGRPALLTRMAPTSALVAIEQGRLKEARTIAVDGVGQLLAMNAGEASARVARLRLLLAQIDMLDEQWAAALKTHELRMQGMNTGQGKEKRGSITPDYAYTLYRLGRYAEAEDMMNRIVAARDNMFDETSLYAYESKAFLAVLQAGAGKSDQAYESFRQSIPGLLNRLNAEGGGTDSGVLRTARLNWILEGYLALLGTLAQQGHADALAESFRIADLARGSQVQQALSAAATRSAPSDPALATLARKEQDLRRDLQSLTDTIGDLLARGRVAEEDKVVADMRSSLESLRGQHQQVLDELARKFPSYAALLNPKPMLPAGVQAVLKDDEAMVSIFSTRTQTYVWAFRQQGPVAFHVAPVGQSGMTEQVVRLRKTLDPSANTTTIPKFDTDTAFKLYQQLLQPVEAGWRGAQKLFVVPHGSLGQVPFAVLLTAPWSEKPGKLPFASLSEAPWLLKEAAVTQLPAALALPLLRTNKRPAAAYQFVGFGDPVFNPDDARQRVASRRNLAIKPAAANKPAETHMDEQIDFDLLAPLPDTSLEIEEIAKVLAVDMGKDAYLRQRASETNVKTQDLSNYRVVMFATHGLVPGEMPGMYQPALALSNPALTGEAKGADVDGMLSMDEVLGLNLNADWVVLSACNTAAGSGKGSEAVSGLGRAFFYAGARSLLVTNWPVETVSARLLTTEVFRQQAESAAPPRAVLLQRSSLKLMGQGSKSFSYAHPMFWAPYVLVGDGG